jgi:hypothetical protein
MSARGERRRIHSANPWARASGGLGGAPRPKAERPTAETPRPVLIPNHSEAT